MPFFLCYEYLSQNTKARSKKMPTPIANDNFEFLLFFLTGAWILGMASLIRIFGAKQRTFPWSGKVARCVLALAVVFEYVRGVLHFFFP